MQAAARAWRRRPPEPWCARHFADGIMWLGRHGAAPRVLVPGGLGAPSRRRRLGVAADDPAFAALKIQHADSDALGGAPPGMPPDRGMGLELGTGGAPMPRSRPVARRRARG